MVGRTAEIGGRFDGSFVELDNLLDRINDRTHEGLDPGRAAELDNDDAGAIVVFCLGELELGAQVEDGNHCTSQIDHTLDVGRHLGHRGDRAKSDNFPDVKNGDAIGLISEPEGEVAPALGRAFLIGCCQRGGEGLVAPALGRAFLIGYCQRGGAHDSVGGVL